MSEDSIEGIYDTLKQCALISKSAGGVGLNVHCIRTAGSYIAGVSGPRCCCSSFIPLEAENTCLICLAYRLEMLSLKDTINQREFV